jgi:hypothetical protein
MAAEDPEPQDWFEPNLQRSERRHVLSSTLVQAGVPAAWSGAYFVGGDGQGVAEGVAGSGDAFMLGRQAPQDLPPEVASAVERAAARLGEVFGPVRFEWVHDGTQLWLVQLHRGSTASQGATIVPGAPAAWRTFEVARGLADLRQVVQTLPPDTGLDIVGRVGMTSHVADILRRAKIPSRLV